MSKNNDDFEIVGSGSTKKDSPGSQEDFQVKIGGGSLTSPSDNPVWRQGKSKKAVTPLRIWLTVIIIVLALAVLITFIANTAGQTQGIEAPVVQPENGGFTPRGERGPAGPPGALPPPVSP